MVRVPRQVGSPTGQPFEPRDAPNLVAVLYPELKRLASQIFRSQEPGHTLQPTALVHEAYLRLASKRRADFEDRKHFYCSAAQAMRQVLINHARDRRRQKRGAGSRRVPLDEVNPVFVDGVPDLLALDDALSRLSLIDARKARVVELRYFAGLGNEQIADVLDVSLATVKRDWALAKSWLLRCMEEDVSSDR